MKVAFHLEYEVIVEWKHFDFVKKDLSNYFYITTYLKAWYFVIFSESRS